MLIHLTIYQGRWPPDRPGALPLCMAVFKSHYNSGVHLLTNSRLSPLPKLFTVAVLLTPAPVMIDDLESTSLGRHSEPLVKGALTTKRAAGKHSADLCGLYREVVRIHKVGPEQGREQRAKRRSRRRSAMTEVVVRHRTGVAKSCWSFSGPSFL